MRASLVVSKQMSGSTKSSQFARWVSLGAIVGPVCFLFAWLVLGLLQPAIKTEYGLIGGVSGAISNPISSLGIGPNARVFNASFVLCGLITFAGVIGAMQAAKVARRTAAGWTCVTLLALSPIGLALAGIYSLATSIVLHNVAALLVFVVPVFAFLVAGLYFRKISDWQRLGRFFLLASPVTFVLLVLFISTFRLPAVAAGHGVAGLTERILLIEIHAWYVALGWIGFRR